MQYTNSQNAKLGSDPNGAYLSHNLCHPGAGRYPVALSVAIFPGFRPAPE